MQAQATPPIDIPDEPQAEPRHSPMRRCIASGRSRHRDELLRFVVGPDDMVVPDVAGRLPGRGLWLSAERDVIDMACAKNLFSRAARRRVGIPDGLADTVEGLLRRRCLDLIGLARRAGQATAGYEKVRAWLREGQAGLVVFAADGSDGSRRKIVAMAPRLPVLDLFDGAELGAALGRDHAVNVAIAAGQIADRLWREATRLKGVRGTTGATPYAAESGGAA